MSNKARRMLVLLLIILKEAGPTAACSSSCSSYCYCTNRGLSSVPQDLPTDITGLNLYNNTITTLSQSDFSRYRSLTTLNLGYNQISMIHNNTFQNLTSLTGLYLYGNHLTSLSDDIFVGLGNLQYLYLHNNKLTSLPSDILEGLGNLQWLWLNTNQLTSLTADIFEGRGNLQRLWLHNNQLSSLPGGIFVGLGNLEWLDLDSNNIHSIEAGTFNDTTKLNHLRLQNNNISTITADIFGNLLQLQTLRLSHNNINTFPVEALSNLNILVLSELTLDNNQLETLPPMAYDILASISAVNIDNNPWQCDCRMAPFKQRMNGSYPFEDQIRCVRPVNLTGQLLQDVNPEDLICEETTSVYSTASTKHMVTSTLSLSPVSSPTPFHLSEMSTSKALKLPQSPSNTPTADSNPGWSIVSTDSPFGFQSTMTESNTGPADGGIVLSVLLLATLGAILGLLLICVIGFAVGCMYMRRQRDPNPLQGFSNTNPTGTSSGHDQINVAVVPNAARTDADIISQSKMLHPGTEDNQHIYNLPTDEDPDTTEYNTIDDVNQSETRIDSLSLSSQPGSGQIQHLGSFNDGYEVPSPSLYPGEGPQYHKYVNSHMAAAAKDAAAGPQDVVYDYEND